MPSVRVGIMRISVGFAQTMLTERIGAGIKDKQSDMIGTACRLNTKTTVECLDLRESTSL